MVADELEHSPDILDVGDIDDRVAHRLLCREYTFPARAYETAAVRRRLLVWTSIAGTTSRRAAEPLIRARC